MVVNEGFERGVGKRRNRKMGCQKALNVYQEGHGIMSILKNQTHGFLTLSLAFLHDFLLSPSKFPTSCIISYHIASFSLPPRAPAKSWSPPIAPTSYLPTYLAITVTGTIPTSSFHLSQKSNPDPDPNANAKAFIVLLKIL